MSKDYYLFKNEKGDVAFLIGLVDVISDKLSLICDYGYTLNADIYPLPDNDLSLLNDIVKKRIHIYKEQLDNYNADKIEQIDFRLRKVETENVNEYIYSIIKKYSSSNNLKEEVDEVIKTLNWQLGKPLGIFESVQLPDSNVQVLGEIYLYLAWNYFFIAYEGYMVMMILGTVE